MTDRLAVTKTYKLFIGGKFPRTESGRSMRLDTEGGEPIAHLCRASRKDLRMAVEAAHGTLAKWSGANAYLRGQIIYRMAEMVEGKRDEFARAIAATGRIEPDAALRETDEAIDRLISFAGWADKYAQVLGCNNPVSGPYYNFTVPQASGVVGVVCPDELPLLAMVSLIAPPLAAGCTLVVLGSGANPLPAAILGEVCATSDVPPGTINLLTGLRDELVEHFASHREIIAIHAAGTSDDQERALRIGTADNLKRVTIRTTTGDEWFDAEACTSPWWIEPFVEMKTIWHPSAS